MVGLVAVVGLVAGCDVGSIRRPGPLRTPSPATSAPPAASSTPARSGIAEVRRARVPVPGSFGLQAIAFVDRNRGYALYAHCGGEATTEMQICHAILVATVDGGRTWSVRRHPRPNATNQQMVVGDDGVVMLLSNPYGWYLSRDGGLTFRRTGPPESPPQEYFADAGRFQVWNPGNAVRRAVEYVNGHRRDLAAQPPFASGPTDVERDESGRLWAVGIEDGDAVAALSRDDGRTWRRLDVPGRDGWLVSAWLEISAGGGDVWLLASAGPSAFPRLWRFGGEGWVSMPAVGAPSRILSIAPVGGGALAVAEPDGAGLVNYRYWDTNWPLAGAQLAVLADGTLMASRALAGEIFLGLGHGLDRRWVQVSLTQG